MAIYIMPSFNCNGYYSFKMLNSNVANRKKKPDSNSNKSDIAGRELASPGSTERCALPMGCGS